MALLDLKTNLKDLKFGNDERGGGNSGQPYVATRIPATNEALQTGFSGATLPLLGAGAGAAVGAIGGSILGASGTGAIIGAAAGLGAGLIAGSQQGNSFKTPTAGTGGPDFLLRGGTLLPNAIIDDETRLAKFFASTEGILFTVKQNLLSRLAVKTQSSPSLLNGDVYTPLSSLIESAGIPFGLHVNKQGLNPFEGIGEGFTPNQYFKNPRVGTTDEFKDWNRLYNLYNNKIISSGASKQAFFNNIAIGDLENILSYSGGPDAPLGIGKTKIKYATDNFGSPLKITNVDSLNNKDPQKGIIVNDIVGYATLGYEQINDITDPNSTEENIGNFKYPKVVDFRNKLRSSLNNFKKYTLTSNAPSYNPGDKNTIEQRVNLGDPGNSSLKNLTSYVSGAGGLGDNTPLGAASENSYDKITYSQIYRSDDIGKNSGIGGDCNDLVKFRIGVYDLSNNNIPKNYMHFRAFLNQITDTYGAEWDATQYIGRGEKFYNYTGFNRRISLSWTVAAQSKAELIPMYKKLNYLASVCAPDYSAPGYMRGNIVQLTIGGYLYEQPGIITGLSYEMNDDNASWEIGINDNEIVGEDPSVKELPHLIRVNSFEFIPIHNFVPRLQQLGFKEGVVTGFGKERYIALSATDDTNNSNYGEIYKNIQSNSTPTVPPQNTPRYG